MTHRHDTGGDAPQPGQDNIVRAMARTAHAMRRYLETTVGDVPGGMSSWHVLRMLHKCGPATQADLARWVGVAGSTLTRRLEQMEDDGLIARADDPDDGRRVIVTLTEKSESHIEAQHAAMDDEIDKLTAGADPADLQAFDRVLAAIGANLAEFGIDLDHRGGRGMGSGRRSGRGGRGGGRGAGRGAGRGPDGEPGKRSGRGSGRGAGHHAGRRRHGMRGSTE